jgi:hypothetical protein
VIDPLQLGALYAGTAVLALLVLLGVGGGLGAWAWWSRHGHGALTWSPKKITLELHRDEIPPDRS